VTIRIGMQCGYEGGEAFWALGWYCGMAAIRCGAQLLQRARRLPHLRRSPASGRSFWVWAQHCRMAAIRCGAQLLQRSRRLPHSRRSPASGRSFWVWAQHCRMAAIRCGAQLLQVLHCLAHLRRSPASGRSFWVWARYCWMAAIRCGGAAPTGRVALGCMNEKGRPEGRPFLDGLTELSSVFPFEHGADHQWWSGRWFQRLACYAVPSSHPSRLQRLST